MSLHHHKFLRKRDGPLPFSGSVIETNPTPTASVLAQNSHPVPDSSSTGVPLVDSPPSGSTTTTAQSSSATTIAASSTSPASQIPIGTVIGACVAAVAVLILAVLLAVHCSRRQKRATAYSKSRNAARNTSRRRSHLEPWKRMHDDGQEQATKQRPPSNTLGTMFQRTLSNISAEKSSETHNRESVGTMQHFAKYHPGLAAEMASQGVVTGVDSKIAKPPPAHLLDRGPDMGPPLSWDGGTLGTESFMSLHSSWSNSTSPMMMANAKSTPAATTSSLHRWESAEVVHVGSEVSESGELQNPFADSRTSMSTVRSTKGHNPFFSGRDHPVRRTVLPDTQKNPFADPDAPRDSSDAIQSLIAALERPMEPSDRIVSVQSSLYSRMTADDGESAISVTAFPYPPTQINVR